MALIESSSVTFPNSVFVTPAEWDTDGAVVWLRGEHDISTVAALSKTVARAIALNDADLVLDLSEVLFMSAATAEVIIQTREFLRLRSRALVLRSPSRCARLVLDLCGLADLIDAGPIDATDPAGALRTWVAVPAIERVEQRAETSTPRPGSAPDPVRLVTPAKVLS